MAPFDNWYWYVLPFLMLFLASIWHLAQNGCARARARLLYVHNVIFIYFENEK